MHTKFSILFLKWVTIHFKRDPAKVNTLHDKQPVAKLMETLTDFWEILPSRRETKIYKPLAESHTHVTSTRKQKKIKINNSA